jgi:hypothetical protein
MDTSPHVAVKTLALWIHRLYTAWKISYYESIAHTLRDNPEDPVLWIHCPYATETPALWIHCPYAIENHPQLTGSPFLEGASLGLTNSFRLAPYLGKVCPPKVAAYNRGGSTQPG